MRLLTNKRLAMFY